MQTWSIRFVAAMSAFTAASCLHGCTDNSCEDTLACPSIGADNATAAGGFAASTATTGGAAQGGNATASGGNGGDGPVCGNGIAEPGELCFTSPIATFATTKLNAHDLEITDCDNDGDRDVVTVGEAFDPSSMQDENMVIVMTNDGSGALTAGTPYVTTVVGTGYRIALGEFNGTPGDDLVTATQSDVAKEVQLYGLAGCSLTPIHTMTLTTAYPVDAAVVRLAGDGLDDIVTICGGQKLNYAPSTASATTEIEIAGAQPVKLATGELNGDGLLDVAWVDATTDNLFHMLATRAGVSEISVSSYAQATPMGLAIGDLDNDSDNDIVVANLAANSLRLFENDGNSNLTNSFDDLPIQPGLDVPAAHPRDVRFADLDLDGDLDIITANSNDAAGKSSVSIYLNDGAANFTHATSRSFPAVARDSPLEVGRRPFAVRVADMNADGALDIITSSAHHDGITSMISVLLAVP